MSEGDPAASQLYRDYFSLGTARVQRGGLRGKALPGFESLPVESYPWRAAAQRRHPPLPDGYFRAKWSRTRLVLSATHGGHRVFVKRYRTAKLVARIYELFIPPKMRREWRVTRAFLRAGALTALPVFYARTRDNTTYLATLSLPEGWTSLEAFCRSNGLDRELLLDVARVTRWLHELPAYHNDYRTDHIYIVSRNPALPLRKRFAFIDVDGGYCGKRVSRYKRREAFFELFVSLGRHGLTRATAQQMGEAYEREGTPLGLDYGRIWDKAIYDIREAGPRRRARDKKRRERLKALGLQRS